MKLAPCQIISVRSNTYFKDQSTTVLGALKNVDQNMDWHDMKNKILYKKKRKTQKKTVFQGQNSRWALTNLFKVGPEKKLKNSFAKNLYFLLVFQHFGLI